MSERTRAAVEAQARLDAQVLQTKDELFTLLELEYFMRLNAPARVRELGRVVELLAKLDAIRARK